MFGARLLAPIPRGDHTPLTIRNFWSRALADLDREVRRRDAVDHHRDLRHLVAVERDLELIEAVEVEPIAGDLCRADAEILDRGVDAADRAAQPAGTVARERARDLEIDHAGLVLAAERDQALTDLEVARREHRQRDVDAVDLERLEPAAVLALLLLVLGAGLAGAEVG